MSTTDPRAWLAEAQETVDTERVLRDGDPFYEVQGYLPDGTPLMECNRWERVGLDVSAAMAAALTAVLDLLDRAEKAANDSPARMFGGAPFPAVLDADAIRTAITEHLGGDA